MARRSTGAASSRAGYDGGYSRVTDFIRAWRERESQAAVANAFIPLAFELGEAYQFDWSEEGLVVGGIYYRVQVARNRCSVPCELYGQMVSTRLYPASVVIVADDKVVARHDRLSNAGETRYDWQHYIPLLQRKPGALRNGAPFADMPEALQRLRRGLLRNPGGDRVMAQVLAIVLTAGLVAVLVAVELALETGPPGKVSVEHVVNVLGRLNAQPAPPTAATHLKVATAPLAETARYDRLRGVGAAVDGDRTTEEASHEA